MTDQAVQRRSLNKFIERLSANLWPDTDDKGLARWQVNEMDLTITNSGGTKELVHLRLEPGVSGIQAIWSDKASGHAIT